MATTFVRLVNGLLSTGHCHVFVDSSLSIFNIIISLLVMDFPVTGSSLCFIKCGVMAPLSNIIPSRVHTGVV